MKLSTQKSGFTLVETVMVIGIFVLMSGVIFISIYYLYQFNSYTIDQSYEVDNARRGLQTWLDDTREMTYADDGTFPVAVMEPYQFSFYSDIDGDASVEYVEYVLSTTTINKYIYESTSTPPVYNLSTPSRVETLSEYVQNLNQSTSTFLYFDTTGSLLAGTSSSLIDIRYIEARIIVNIDPLRSPGEFLLRGGVAPRNLKDNL